MKILKYLSLIVTLLTAIQISALTVTNYSNEFWISTNATGNFVTNGIGNGGALELPLDGSSQPNFDWNMDNIPPNSKVHILAGNYITRGFAVQSFEKIAGSGMGATVVQFPTNMFVGGSGCFMIFSVGPVTNAEISDMTLDCNSNNTLDTYSGVGIDGTQNAIRRIRLINCAKFAGNSEAWGLTLDNFSLPDSRENIIEDCEVSQFRGGNANLSAMGFVAGGSPYSNAMGGTIRNNTIIGSGSVSSSAAVFALLCGTDGTLVEGNHIINVNAAFHTETGYTNLIISHNWFENCLHVIEQISGDSRNITFSYNNVELTTNFDLVTVNPPAVIYGGYFTNLDIIGNTVSIPGLMGTSPNFFLQVNGNCSGAIVAENSLDSNLQNSIGGSINLNMFNNYDLFGNFLSGQNIVEIGGVPVTSLGYSFLGASSPSVPLIAMGLPSNPAEIVTYTNLSQCLFTNSVHLTSSGTGGNGYLTYTNEPGAAENFGFSSNPYILGWDNAVLGSQAFASAQSTCVGNVAIGKWAMSALTNGSLNVAIGDGPLGHSVAVQYDIAIGVNVLNYDSGAYNVGMGAFTMQFNTTGSGNTALGNDALQSNTNGNFNTIIGDGAAYQSASGSGNVMVGAGDGLSVNSSRNILIGDGVDVPLPDVGSQMNIGGVIFGNGLKSTDTENAIAYPGNIGLFTTNLTRANFTVNGTTLLNSNVTVIGTNSATYFSGNGAGLTNLALPAHPFFFAVLTNNLTITSSTDQRVWFNNNISSNNINYSTNSGFVVATSGLYQINATVAWLSVSGGAGGLLNLVKNGVDYLRVQSNPSQNGSLTLSTTILLNSGDTIDFNVWQNSGSTVQIAGNVSPVYQSYLSILQIQ